MKKIIFLMLALAVLVKCGSAQLNIPTIKLDSVVVYSYSTNSNKWVKTNKQIFEYDSLFRLIEITSTAGLYPWSTNSEKARFRYNEAGLVESINLFNQINYELSDIIKFHFTYDNVGRLLSAYSYNSYNGNWEINIGKNYKYDKDGNIKEIFVEENWWAYWTSLHQYAYDSSGKLIRYANDFYSILTTYEWNTEGNLIEQHYQSWYQKRDHTFKYDTDGKRLKSEKEYSTKQLYENEFTLQEKSTETYTYLDINHDNLVKLNLSLLDIDNELDDVEYIPDKLISTVNYNLEYSLRETGKPKIQKSEYFYSLVPVAQPLISGLDNKLNGTIIVYPNPATNQVTFAWDTRYDRLNLKIYNLTGTCFLDREISSNEIISLKNISKGVYIYKLSDHKQMLKTGKLVIE
jgi:hypothetical protein